MEESIDDLFKLMELSENSLKNEDIQVETKPSINACYSCLKECLVKTKEGLCCSHCGVVKENFNIDESAEWNFAGEDGVQKDPSRCGCPTNPLLPRSSMSLMISKSWLDKKHFMLSRLHQQNSMDYVERSRYHVFVNIQRMAMENGNLSSSVSEQAKYYYKLVSERKLSRGSVRKGLIACCILYACKFFNVPRSIKEIGVICELEPTKITNAVKIFEDLLRTELNTANIIKDVTNASDLASRFTNCLDIDRKLAFSIAKDTRKLSDSIEAHGVLMGKTPTAVVSAIICFIISQRKINISKKTISEKHNISIVTINKILKEVINHQKIHKIDIILT